MPTQLSEAPAILRGMLRDVVPCRDYRAVCEALDMVPAGPDVDEIEHYKSHMRIKEFNEVANEVFAHAEIAAELLYKLDRLNHDVDDEDEDDAERHMISIVSRTAAAVVIGHLIEKGTLGVSR